MSLSAKKLIWHIKGSWAASSNKHGHVLHLLISVPWVRLDDVKDVVHDGLCAVVLVALGSVVVQVSSACLTNKQARWFYINKKNSPGASTRA